jgi:hypothetical protein
MLGNYAITGDWATVTNRVGSLDSPLLEFSFRNSWNVLSREAQKALAVLSIFDEPPTRRLWATSLSYSIDVLERTLTELIETTFVSPQFDRKTGQETYRALPITLFLHENVQTEAVSIHFDHFAANRGYFYSDFGP